VITYAITVENTGTMTLTGVTVDDPLLQGPNGALSGPSGDTNNDGELDVGETWTFTGSYTAQQSDINDDGGGDGDIDNTATVHSDQLADQSSSTATPIDRNPAYSIQKTVTDVGGDGPNGHVDAANDVISYQIVVSNDGNVDLTGASVTDPLLEGANGTLSGPSGDTDNDGTLDVGETWTYTGSYTAQQSDIDDNGGQDGDIDNTATVHSDELPDQSSSTATPIDYNAQVTLLKTGTYVDSNENDIVDVGDTIEYTFAITNGGNVTLHNVGVSDVDGSVSVTGTTIGSLAPGALDGTTWSGSYAINQADVDAGYHDNTAVVISDQASAPDTAHTLLLL
jgi:uncharacterized repeat protein (TIGR01451 family)